MIRPRRVLQDVIARPHHNPVPSLIAAICLLLRPRHLLFRRSDRHSPPCANAPITSPIRPPSTTPPPGQPSCTATTGTAPRLLGCKPPISRLSSRRTTCYGPTATCSDR
jgi:hypothetical protein